MMDKEDVIDAYEAHKEDWGDSAPATFPLSQLSLLAYASIEDGNIAYLVWPYSGNGKELEQEVWTYVGHSESRFRNLAEFLESLFN
ncbi:hypothetical protein [Paenibacillus solani]|uniref:hypothetical protein n=1 Tax=Paenibacillus solani TaxID=1705565 RepID=UPI003D27C97A